MRESKSFSEGSEQCAKGVNATFKELVYKILEHIKNEPYLRWMGKIGEDLSRRN